MSAPTSVSGNLFINGRFLRGLWARLEGAPNDTVACPVWAQTFAADRWHVRYAEHAGAAVSQSRSSEVPTGVAAEYSLEIRGQDGVTTEVLFGQNLEAEEAPNYRHALHFSASVFAQHPTAETCEMALVIGSPVEVDLFDETAETVLLVECGSIPLNRWERIELEIDTTSFRSTGLRVELAISPEYLGHAAAGVRLADLCLSRSGGPVMDRPPALERQFASRYFQRHDGTSVNALGRVLAANAHELHFQFSFPEMRAFPACTISQDNADLTVFSPHGAPQTGFSYDVTHGARTSIVIRATKLNHGLTDGYLAFNGFRGAVLLDAEL